MQVYVCKTQNMLDGDKCNRTQSWKRHLGGLFGYEADSWFSTQVMVWGPGIKPLGWAPCSAGVCSKILSFFLCPTLHSQALKLSLSLSEINI